MTWVAMKVKRKRDIQGKFALKGNDYRKVRSLRLTDATWKTWGIEAERLGLSRADLLEKLVQQNQGTFPSVYSEKSVLKNNIKLKKDELNKKVDKVLAELRLGKEASNYKLVHKSLNRLLELILSSSK